jgi:hypothetical protein
VFLPVWGIVGAAVSTLVAFVVQGVANYAMLPRQPRWPATPRALWAAVGACSLVAVGSTFVPDTALGMVARFVAGLACLPWLAVEFRRARGDLVPRTSANPSDRQSSRQNDITVDGMSQWSDRHPSSAHVPGGRLAGPAADSWPTWSWSDQHTQPGGPRAARSRPSDPRDWSWADWVVLVYRAVLASLALWVTSRLVFDLGLLARFTVLSAVGVLVATVWSVGASAGWLAEPPGPLGLTVVTYQVMTSVVAAMLLAPPWPDAQFWALVTRVVLPTGFLVDFVLFQPHRRLRPRACWWALAVPVAYFGALGLTGAVAEVPYEIFQVRELGWPQVGAHVAACLAVATSACAAALAVDSMLLARPLVGPRRLLR